MKPLSPTIQRLLTAGAALLLALLPACGGDAAPEPDPAAAPQPEGATSRGVLEVIDPQDPERPHFHDFGEMDWGDEVKWSVTMRNTGDEPVSVQRALPACGCTRLASFAVAGPDGESVERIADFDKKPICTVQPGGTLEMRIDILSKHSKPNMSKLALVRLTTNSELNMFHTFELRFLGMKPFIVAPDNLTMNRVPVSHGGEVKCRVQVVKAGLPGQVHRIVSAPDGIETRLEARPFAGETVWTVFATVPPLAPMGTIRGDIVLAVSDENGEGDAGRVTIPVLARVGPDAYLDPGMFTFGAVPVGAERLRQAQLTGLVPGAFLEITDARIEGTSKDHFTASFRAAGNNEGGRVDESGRSTRWIIDLQLKADHPEGYIDGEVILTLAEPIGGGAGDLGTEVRARVSGLVRK